MENNVKKYCKKGANVVSYSSEIQQEYNEGVPDPLHLLNSPWYCVVHFSLQHRTVQLYSFWLACQLSVSVFTIIFHILIF